MKKALFFLFLMLNLNFTVKETIDMSNGFNILEFNNWKLNKKVKFINKLNQKGKIAFIRLFFSDNTFSIPPYEIIKFFSDGEMIIDWLTDDKGMAGGNYGDKELKYFIGKWKIENDEIILSKIENNNRVVFEEVRWDSVVAEDFDGKLSLDMMYKGKEAGVLIHESDERNIGSPAIESYTKLKEEQRRLQAQTKISSITETSVK